ncbi:MAG TPA: AAA-like domain-containing protein [Candidatus Deferrimicrobium sp.]|nr:AAA-like domain-containing protein [Candidatus Kapabacteria bacterium]HLP60583.1 AAA-like domain-containing protein [Candidatus Deferrimicrobium sp.]
MRRFSSYGPVNEKLNYYAPRKELIEKGYNQLVGENPEDGGHYFTVWAPRQCGKTWLMQEVVQKIKKMGQYRVAMISMEPAKNKVSEEKILEIFVNKMTQGFQIQFPKINSISDISSLFTRQYFQEPVILIIDEFDSLEEEFINSFAGIFRDIYIGRTGEPEKTSNEKFHLLHGVALIGVRSVLGIENVKGSPFNVQRSLHVPNLTYDEVKGMFADYQRDSGQDVDEQVVRTLYKDTCGQPGLTCWFGELLTEGTEDYTNDRNKPISISNYEEVYAAATHILPNNNILNLISKVNKPPYDEIVVDFFKTGDKIEFKFNNKDINYLYMNGIISPEKADMNKYYIRFSSPFVQRSLFDYFANYYFDYLGQLVHPLDDMKDAITEETLFIPHIIKRYRDYLKKNRDAFFKNVPRRKNDLRIYEAIYHFNLYRYLYDLLKSRGVEVIPQFPTGNGKIDLLLKYREKTYAIELKSFKDMFMFEKGIEQAEVYGRQLGLNEVTYLVFVELNQEEAKQLEKEVQKPGIKVIVLSIGIL